MKAYTVIKTIVLGLLVSSHSFASIDVPQSILSMKVKTDGIYRVTHSDLMALNIDLTGVHVKKIAITRNGQIIPVKVYSENSTFFSSNSYIEFVGNPSESLYQEGTVYSLILANSISVSEKSVESNPSIRAEAFYMQTDLYAENTEYSFGAPIDDPWFAKRMLAIGSEVTEDFVFAMDNVVKTNRDVTLEMNIWGGTDYLQSPDHHVIYSLNGNLLDDFRFDGITSDIRRYEIPANSFVSGDQTLEIRLPNDTNTLADVIHIESWQVTYPRAFVLNDKKIIYSVNTQGSQSQSSTQASSGDLLFANGFEAALKRFTLKNASNENYLVYKVSASGNVEFYPSTVSGSCNSIANMECSLDIYVESGEGQIYVAAESQLMLPELSLPVLMEDINKFKGNYLIIAHPDFIGAELDQFIQSKANEYDVVLVDVEQIYAQYSFSNISATALSDYIKFAASEIGIKDVLLVGGDTYDYKNILSSGSISFIPTLYGSTDDLITFAPIDAKYSDIDNDNIPDINIGRFPVRTEQELANLRQKIAAYSNKTYANTVVFAADKFDVSNGYSFKNDAELLISQLPETWQQNISLNSKAYVDDDGIAVAKAKITNNINEGVALTSFIGHSGPRDWSFSRMFSFSDANLLVNASSPTLVTQWGCWNTYFVSPTEDTMAHAFMLNQNGGAASVLGASTLTKAEHEKDLAQLVLNKLTQQNMTLGNAVTQAKREYALTNPEALDVILGWNILGDPSLKL